MKILIVEDNPVHLKLAKLVLIDAGNQVSSADAAEKVRAMISSDRPEVILVDMKLPGLDGLSLVRQLKADPDLRDIPVIAVTAYPDSWTSAEAFRAGCDGYIVKPVNTRSLARQVMRSFENESDGSTDETSDS